MDQSRGKNTLPSGRRGQSESVGLILVFSMVVIGASVVVVFGATAMADSEEALSVDRAEKSMTQFGSQAALVALGNTDIQRTSLPRADKGDYTVKADAGWMNVSYHTGSDDEVKVFNESMGAVVYDIGEERISYQGGGVWRSSGQGQAVMVSPPDFHYQDRTLTLPLILIRGEGSPHSAAQITHQTTDTHYPIPADEDFQNPVNGTEVNVTLQSEYYKGWGAYFETRTNGEVTYDHDRNVTMISLIPEFDENFDNALATTDPDGINVNGNGGEPSPSEEGANYPIIDAEIERMIDDCQTNGCTNIPTRITSDGTYWTNGDHSSSITVDNPGGDVKIIINGDYEPGNVEVRGVAPDNSVDVYVKGDFIMGGGEEYNVDEGDPDDTSVSLHSDGEVVFGGNPDFVGLIYAPQSECTINGGPTITGGAVCKSLTDNGNPSQFNYDSSVNDIDLDVAPADAVRLQYLHVTTNEIEITSG